MNERIKELGRQAWAKTLESVEFYDAVGDLNEDFHIKYNQVFAELLVARCAEIVEAAKPGMVDGVPAEVALDLTAKNIKAYFGVK